MFDSMERAWAGALVAILIATLPSGVSASAADGAAVPLTVGANSSGQLGRTAIDPSLQLGPVDGPPLREIASGRDHNYGIDQAGALWAWGDNGLNQIGDGTTIDRGRPVSVGLDEVASIASGHYHGLAVRRDGTLSSWGYGGLGQLGSGSTSNRATPERVGDLTGVTGAAAGRDMSFAVLSDGSVLGWGSNTSGEVGDGSTVRRLAPVPVVGLPPVRLLAAGRNHALALDRTGRLWGWGDNAYGQLGDGTTSDRPRPTLVLDGPVVDVAAGAHHSVALLADGRVMTWGRGYRGQLGLGSTGSRLLPTEVPGLSGISSIGAGRDNTFSVAASGDVWGWGSNDSGQVGDGTTTRRTAPVRLPVSGVTTMEGGSAHAILLQSADPPSDQPPTASFPVPQCTGLTCSVVSTSVDTDGTVQSTTWGWGDGTPDSAGPTASHTYAAAGEYVITLRVTDDVGNTSSATRGVTVSTPVGPSLSFRAAASATGNWTTARVRIPAEVQSGDAMLLFATTNTLAAITVPPPGWVVVGVQTAPAREDMRTVLYRRVATPTDGGSSVALGFDRSSKFDLTLLAYGGTDDAEPVAAFASAGEAANVLDHESPSIDVADSRSWVVSFWADKSSSTTAWDPPADQISRISTIGSGSGRVSTLAVDSGQAVPGGLWSGRIASTDYPVGKVTMWTVVLRASG